MFFKVKVLTKEKTENVIQVAPDKLEIKVKEKPKMGRANDRVRQLLAVHLGVSAGKIKLVKGANKPNKIFEIKENEKLKNQNGK